MTTLFISDLLDDLTVAIEAARTAAAGQSRWLNAIEAGYDWLLQKDQIEYDLFTFELAAPSASELGTVYRANGVCQCRAYDDGIAFHGTPWPCWHRAASRLVQRALQRQAAAARRVRAYAEIDECFA